DEVLRAARRVARQRGQPGLAQRRRQQPVRAVAALVRPDVVDLVQVDPLDLLEGHEFDDVHGPFALRLQRLQLLVRERDVLPPGELVALHHVLALDLLAVLRADVLLPQARAALLVQPVEGHGRRGLRGRVQLDRDGDEPEGDRGRCDCTCAHEPSAARGIHKGGGRDSTWTAPTTAARPRIACSGEPAARPVYKREGDPNAMKPTQSDALRAYREKRSLDRTPEPGGGVSPVSGSLFVVHKHAATRTHYDLRLELEGVLKPWAVPKGPSRDLTEKRLAVHVEDHPVEYGDFEGVIPEGNYGAGAVIVWDRGQWVPIEDPIEGLRKGK